MFVLRWRTMIRAFSNLGSVVRGKGAPDDDPLQDVEALGAKMSKRSAPTHAGR